MESITVDAMRTIARLAGFDWSDAELERVRPAVERALGSLEALERLPLRDVEAALQYRAL